MQPHCLMFSGRFFAQVLEGSSEAINVAADRIRLDPRHTDFRLLVERPITERFYADWTMGYLHKLDLEDDIEALVSSDSIDVERIVQVMAQMQPDTVMGSLT